jgi:hypothetical protein
MKSGRARLRRAPRCAVIGSPPVDAFSYLSVLLSIILGLAITQLLQGLGRLLQERRRVRLYWPSIAWAGLLLVILVQTWWAMFGLRNQQSWSFGGFAVVILHVTLLFLLAALVFPDFSQPGGIDLRENYFGHSRWFFSLAVATTLASLAKDLVLGGHLPAPANTAFHGCFMAMGISAAATRREWFHKAQTVAMIGVFSLYIALLFTRLR